MSGLRRQKTARWRVWAGRHGALGVVAAAPSWVPISASLERDDLWPYPILDLLAEVGVVVTTDGMRIVDEHLGGVTTTNAIAWSSNPAGCWLVVDDDAWQHEGTIGITAPNPWLVAHGATVHSATTLRDVAGLAGIAVERSAGVVRKIGELWRYRELIQNLVLRDLRVRYRGSALGYLWTQLSPLLLMLVFWLVFAVFLPSNIAMYPVFLIVGLLPWNFCAEALVSGARSVIDNGPLVKKVFFPREVLPLTAVLSSLLNFLLSLPMLFIVIAIVQALYPPLQQAGRITNLSWTVGYLPVLIALQTIFVAGVVFLLAALAVFFRDAVHLIGIMVQFWFFLTPVVYSLDAIGGTTAQIVRWLNPMASLIDFYREVLYGNVVGSGQVPSPAVPGLDSLARVFVTALAVLVAGYWFFQRRSAEFGERL